MGRILRVFDFDDTLAKSVAYIYVKHKDGKKKQLCHLHNMQNINPKEVMSLISEILTVC